MSSSKPRFFIHTLGCKVNQYDSEKMRSHLIRKGYESMKAEDEGSADLIIVNTCSVTVESDRKDRQIIRQLIRKHPQAKVMVTGCYSERFPERIEAIPGVHHIVPITEQDIWLRKITRELGWGCEDQASLWDSGEGIEIFFERTRAFIKIQDGCDLHCTYCSIPLSRGKARSRRNPEILEESKKLVDKGYPELVICGICLGHFGADTQETLADLLRDMVKIPGLKRLRISSYEPQNLTNHLFEVMAENQDILCPHLHLPLQSGSDVVLRKMKRPYTYAYYLDRIEKARELIPGFEATTDLIVGFPGETEEDVEASIRSIRDCRFVKVHLFPFSVREDTPAARMPNRISPPVIEMRRKKLDVTALEISTLQKSGYLEKTLPILVESKEDGYWAGFTPNYIYTHIFSEKELEIGQIQPVRMENLVNGTLAGSVVVNSDFLTRRKMT